LANCFSLVLAASLAILAIGDDGGAATRELTTGKDIRALSLIESMIAAELERLAPRWAIWPATTAQPAGASKFFLMSNGHDELAVAIRVFEDVASVVYGHVHPVPVPHRTLHWKGSTALTSDVECIGMSFSGGTSRARPFVFVEQRVVVTIGMRGDSYEFMVPIAVILRDSIRRVLQGS